MHFSSAFLKIASVHLMPLGQSGAPGTLGCVSCLKTSGGQSEVSDAALTGASQLESRVTWQDRGRPITIPSRYICHLACRLCTDDGAFPAFYDRVHKTLNRWTGSSGARRRCQRSMHLDANLRAASGVFPLLPQFQMFCFRGGIPSEAVEPSVVT